MLFKKQNNNNTKDYVSELGKQIKTILSND